MIKVWAGLNWKYLQKTNRSKCNLTDELFSFIEWKILKKKKEGKLLVNSIFCFSLKVFFKSFHHQSASFSKIESLLMCHISRRFSGSQSKTAGNMHKLRSRTRLSLNYAVEIPVCSAKN